MHVIHKTELHETKVVKYFVPHWTYVLWHHRVVASIVASQQECLRFNSDLDPWTCMLWLHNFPLGTPASSHNMKTCQLGTVASLYCL